MKKVKYTQRVMLERLEELAERLDISVSYEKGIEGPGGFCRVKNQNMILINKDLTTNDRISVIAEALNQFSLDEIYILPEVREFLECHQEKQTNT